MRIGCNQPCARPAGAAADGIAETMRPGIVDVERESLGQSPRKNCLQGIVIAGPSRQVRLYFANIGKRGSGQQTRGWRWPLRGVIRIRTIGIGNVDEWLEE